MRCHLGPRTLPARGSVSWGRSYNLQMHVHVIYIIMQTHQCGELTAEFLVSSRCFDYTVVVFFSCFDYSVVETSATERTAAELRVGIEETL